MNEFNLEKKNDQVPENIENKQDPFLNAYKSMLVAWEGMRDDCQNHIDKVKEILSKREETIQGLKDLIKKAIEMDLTEDRKKFESQLEQMEDTFSVDNYLDDINNMNQKIIDCNEKIDNCLSSIEELSR